jgi:hypothetical protein
MKKVILALLIITIAPLAYSQELEFGLKAGLSSDKVYLSNLGSLDASVEGNTTYNFGAYGRLKLFLLVCMCNQNLCTTNEQVISQLKMEQKVIHLVIQQII